jgi:hypothetical protein
VNGIGSAARFSGPNGVAIDDNGNVYVADTFDALIRKVTLAGVVTTIAGIDNGGRVQSTVLGTSPAFTTPTDVAISGKALILSDSQAYEENVNAIVVLENALQ